MPAPHRDLKGAQRLRLQILLRGAVQGMGFRPFVYRLAAELGVSGWASNSTAGLRIEVEGGRDQLERFQARLIADRPPQSQVEAMESSWAEAVGYSGFEIQESDAAGPKTALVLPDLATCAECVREIFDPANRRHRYPFTNCTACGPRFTIIEALPYDRPNTTMKGFKMCPVCQGEYDNPADRRFHAQPNACPVCGPHLELWDRRGEKIQAHEAALDEAVRHLRAGALVAMKGMGGFHLLALAQEGDSVRRLRERKHREEKPFAVMCSSLEQVRHECELSREEEELLTSQAAPIVLLRRRSPAESEICAAVAPGNPYLGVMLPYTPLHHLLMAGVGMPVVATSGNLADEPICIDEHEAVQRLGGIAEVFLVHNRPIVRHVDDSIARIMAGRELVLRRARGYAPLPVSFAGRPDAPVAHEREGRAASESPEAEAGGAVLAVGAHLKNTIALAVGNRAFVSQHIGDLATPQAYAAFVKVIGDFQSFYEVRPTSVAADLHPDYLSTNYAAKLGVPIVRVQHHYAHILACMAEHGLDAPVLGVAWDGTGLGTDGTVWGGEFLRIDAGSFSRVGHLRTFRLPGGEKAIQEPRRSAIGMLYELFGEAVFERTDLLPLRTLSAQERNTIRQMLRRGVQTPVTSSAGRLFDGVAALLGLRQVTAFEGQAAMELEFALEGVSTEATYEMASAAAGSIIGEQGNATTEDQDRRQDAESKEQIPASGRENPGPILWDWAQVVEGVMRDRSAGISTGLISAKVHNSLVAGIVEVARRVGVEVVVLSGGCFQNRYLTERSIRELSRAGFRPFWHEKVPPNDGGVALGQILAVRRERRRAGKAVRDGGSGPSVCV